MQSEQAYFRFLLPSVLKEAARFALRRRPPCGDIPHCGVCILRGAFLCIGKFFPIHRKRAMQNRAPVSSALFYIALTLKITAASALTAAEILLRYSYWIHCLLYRFPSEKSTECPCFKGKSMQQITVQIFHIPRHTLAKLLLTMVCVHREVCYCSRIVSEWTVPIVPRPTIYFSEYLQKSKYKCIMWLIKTGELVLTGWEEVLNFDPLPDADNAAVGSHEREIFYRRHSTMPPVFLI